MTGESETNQYVKAWQCIGCGKIEAPQTCVGICQDRKVEFVYSFQHDETLARLANARAQRDALAALLRRLACTTHVMATGRARFVPSRNTRGAASLRCGAIPRTWQAATA